MIEVKNLTKYYKGSLGAAVKNASLTAMPGEITVLLGPNGAGKSTTIKSIVNLLSYNGEILICGYPNNSLEAKKQFGYIPEVPVLYDLLTVDESIEFIGKAYRLENYKETNNCKMKQLNITVAGTGYVDFIFYPELDRTADCIILELKADDTPQAAIRQIKDRRDALRFQGLPGKPSPYTGRILAVGITYDKKHKRHQCLIEEL